MAGRKDYYYRQKVTETELDAGFALLEQADRAMTTDAGLIGVMANAVVTEKAGTPDLTVDVSGSAVIYNKNGERISWGAIQNVDVSVDELSVSTAVASGGNSKILSIFAGFTRVLSDPRVDGNSLTVYFDRAEGYEFIVRQSAESASPTPVSVDTEHILLADINRTFGQTQILNSDITGPTGTWSPTSGNRREDAFVVTQGTTTLRGGTPEEIAQALFTELASAANLAFTPSDTWADSNPLTSTTVETAINEIVGDLGNTTGGQLIGEELSNTWENTDAIASGSVNSVLEDIVEDLAAKTSAADCGADRVGVFGAGSSVTFSTGSVQEALTAIANAAGSLTGTNTWTGANTFTNIGASTVQAGLTFGTGSEIIITPDPFDIDLPTDGVLNIKEAGSTSMLTVDGLNEEVQFPFSTIVPGVEIDFDTPSSAPIRHRQRTGTGANDGGILGLYGQQGQGQTGAVDNNDGGEILLALGAPGTGGTGADGEYGPLRIQRSAGVTERQYAREFTINGTGVVNFDAPEGDLAAGESAFYEIQVMTILDPVQASTPSYWHEVAYSACQRDTGSTMLHAGGTVHDGGSKPSAEVAIGYTNNGNTPRLTFTGADGGTTKNVQVVIKETRQPAP